MVFAKELVLESAPHAQTATISTSMVVPIVVLVNTPLLDQLMNLLAKVALMKIVMLVAELAQQSVPPVLMDIL